MHQFPVSSRFNLKFHGSLRGLICMSLSLCISCTGLYYSLYISSLGRVYYCTLLLDTLSLSVSLRGRGYCTYKASDHSLQALYEGGHGGAQQLQYQHVQLPYNYIHQAAFAVGVGFHGRSSRYNPVTKEYLYV